MSLARHGREHAQQRNAYRRRHGTRNIRDRGCRQPRQHRTGGNAKSGPAARRDPGAAPGKEGGVGRGEEGKRTQEGRESEGAQEGQPENSIGQASRGETVLSQRCRGQAILGGAQRRRQGTRKEEGRTPALAGRAGHQRPANLAGLF